MQGSGLPIAEENSDDEDYMSSSYFVSTSFSDSDYREGSGDYSQSESDYSDASDMPPSEGGY